MITIDLKGPDGNAFNLIALAVRIAEQLNYSKDQIENLKIEMTKSDYNNLLKVFKDNFGPIINFIDDDEL